MSFFKIIKSNLFWQDTANRIILGINALMNLSLWVFLCWQLAPTDELIPFHYSIYLGIDMLKPWWYLFELPLIGLIILLTNFSLAFIIYKHNRLLNYFLILASLISQCILFWAGVLIVNL